MTKKHILAIVVLIVAVVVFLQVTADRARAARAGYPEAAWLMETEGGGAVLVLGDHVKVGRTPEARLVSVDVRSGARMGTRVLNRQQLDCTPVVGGALWCDDRPHVRLDARTLKNTGGGAELAISGASRGDGCRTVDEVTIGKKTLRGRFLADPWRGTALLTESGAALALRDETKIARVDAASNTAWTVDLGAPCKLAAAFDGKLVIATGDGVHRARAFDLATGKAAWTFELERAPEPF